MNSESREQNFSNSEDLVSLSVFIKMSPYSTDAINASRFAIELVNELELDLPLSEIDSNEEIRKTIDKIDARARTIAGIVTLLTTLLRNNIITFEEVVIATAKALRSNGFDPETIQSKIEQAMEKYIALKEIK